MSVCISFVGTNTLLCLFDSLTVGDFCSANELCTIAIVLNAWHTETIGANLCIANLCILLTTFAALFGYARPLRFSKLWNITFCNW